MRSAALGSRRAHPAEQGDTGGAGLPLWEAGIAGGAASLPDYPASAQNHIRWLALPYLIYRGQVLRADREGARARLLTTRLFDIEMSAAASFPAHSRNNLARKDMPDLDALGEIGPRLSITLSDFGGRGRLKFFLPWRAVFSTTLTNFHTHGYTVTPTLYWRMLNALRPEWIWVNQATANFASRPLSGYFYDVAPAFATIQRPFYDARPGYLGTEISTGLLIPLRNRQWRLFSGAQLGFHQGSANNQSALYRRDINWTLAGGIAWEFFESKKASTVYVP